MTANRILAALVEARALLRSEGNPYHVEGGEKGGQFTSGPGGGSAQGKPHGKHWAKRQRRKAKRKDKLEAIRKDYKQSAKELKGEHRVDRKTLIKDQRKEHAALKKEHVKDKVEHRKYEAKEKKDLVRGHKKDHAKLVREHKSELAREDKHHEKNKAKIDAVHAEAHAALKPQQEAKAAKLAKAREQGRPHEGLEARLAKQTEVKGKRIDRQREGRHKDEKERHESDRESIKESHASEHEAAKSDRAFDRSAKIDEIKESRKTLKEEHKEGWADLKKEHQERREELHDQQKEERSDLVESLKEELRTEGFYGKGRRDPTEPRQARSVDPGHVLRANLDRRHFGVGRTHKASSAEAILRHALRQRGWTGEYSRGQLSGRQRLRLLEDIRRYARAWLRHEAEAFFKQYGREIDASNGQSQFADLGSRAISEGFGKGASEVVWGGTERGLAGAMVRHVGRFFNRAKSFVHEAILAGVRAFFDVAELTEETMRLVDEESQVQARYFDRFHQEVLASPPIEIAEPTPIPVIQPTPIPAIQPMTAKQFIARAEQYGDASWGAAQQVNRQRMVKGAVYILERRIHGRLVDDMCDTCSTAVAMGWQPIGTLPRIGNSECLGNCHCYFQYQNAQGNVATTVRKSHGKKAPKAVPPVLVSPPAPSVAPPPNPAPVIIEPPKLEPIKIIELPIVPVVIEPSKAAPPVVELPKPKPVKVNPVEPVKEPPLFLEGPWVDDQGKAIMYYSTAGWED